MMVVVAAAAVAVTLYDEYWKEAVEGVLLRDDAIVNAVYGVGSDEMREKCVGNGDDVICMPVTTATTYMYTK